MFDFIIFFTLQDASAEGSDSEAEDSEASDTAVETPSTAAAPPKQQPPAASKQALKGKQQQVASKGSAAKPGKGKHAVKGEPTSLGTPRAAYPELLTNLLLMRPLKQSAPRRYCACRRKVQSHPDAMMAAAAPRTAHLLAWPPHMTSEVTSSLYKTQCHMCTIQAN